ARCKVNSSVHSAALGDYEQREDNQYEQRRTHLAHRPKPSCQRHYAKSECRESQNCRSEKDNCQKKKWRSSGRGQRFARARKIDERRCVEVMPPDSEQLEVCS